MILNVYKPTGCTSFYMVKNIRRIMNEKKVGHGGTLDPFAEGVLIIGTGKDTKKLTDITNENKIYDAELSNLKGIEIIKPFNVKEHNYFKYIILLKNKKREIVHKRLEKNSISQEISKLNDE